MKENLVSEAVKRIIILRDKRVLENTEILVSPLVLYNTKSIRKYRDN